MNVNDELPQLVVCIERALVEMDRCELAKQLRGAVIQRVTYDDTHKLGYIYLGGLREPNIVERNIIGVRGAETISLEGDYEAVLDVDNLGRITGIEILNPGDIKSDLERLSAA